MNARAALARVPVDAPALEVAVPRVYTPREPFGADGWARPVPLPLLLAGAIEPDPLGLLSPGGVLLRALARAGVTDARDRAVLAGLLSRGHRASDGLPAWRGDWRAPRPDDAFRAHRRGVWSLGRGVWCAVGLDVDGVSVHRLALALQLASTGDDRRRSVQRVADRGRALLHALGAWPWALTPTGHLPPGWAEAPRFAVELRRYLAAYSLAA